jgi:hypothetical protein
MSCGCPDAAMRSICCCSRCCQALQVPTNRSCKRIHVLQDRHSSNRRLVHAYVLQDSYSHAVCKMPVHLCIMLWPVKHTHSASLLCRRDLQHVPAILAHATNNGCHSSHCSTRPHICKLLRLQLLRLIVQFKLTV